MEPIQSASKNIFDPIQLPIAFGLLRLCTEGRPPVEDSIRLIHFALDNGVRILDTADSYCLDNKDFHFGEQLVRQALQTWSGPKDEVRVLTKVGLTRPGGKWIPNGSAKHIAKSVEASLNALGVDQLFLLQLHVKDSRTPFDETLTALQDLQSAGKVLHIGLCNVSPSEMRQASRKFQIAAVQNELSLLVRKSATDGTLFMTKELGIPFLAYRPLGGQAKVEKLGTNRVLTPLALRHAATAQEIALAAVLEAETNIIGLIGATKESSIASSLKAACLKLDMSDRTAIRIKYAFDPDPNAVDAVRAPSVPSNLQALEPDQGPSDTDEVVILMGIQGAGKSELVQAYEACGYARLNRDLLGGKVEDLVPKLQQLLASGTKRVVLDNTYPTRLLRASIVRVSHAANVPVRCRLLDTSIQEARINIVQRMLDRYGFLPGPVELKELAKTDPNLPPPIAMQRWLDTLERPEFDEGFSAIDIIPFERRDEPDHQQKGLLLDVDGTLRRTLSGELYPRSANDLEILCNRKPVLERWVADGYLLFFVSNQSGIASGKLSQADTEAAFLRTAALLEVPITEVTYCPHPAFPVGCFCRKPMPGLGVYLKRKYKLNLEQSIMVGDMDSDEAFANAIGVQYRTAESFFSDANS